MSLARKDEVIDLCDSDDDSDSQGTAVSTNDGSSRSGALQNESRREDAGHSLEERRAKVRDGCKPSTPSSSGTSMHGSKTNIKKTRTSLGRAQDDAIEILSSDDERESCDESDEESDEESDKESDNEEEREVPASKNTSNTRPASNTLDNREKQTSSNQQSSRLDSIQVKHQEERQKSPIVSENPGSFQNQVRRSSTQLDKPAGLKTTGLYENDSSDDEIAFQVEHRKPIPKSEQKIQQNDNNGTENQGVETSCIQPITYPLTPSSFDSKRKAQLLQAVSQYGSDFKLLNIALPNWTDEEIARYLSVIRSESKGKDWSNEEVQRLNQGILVHGCDYAKLEIAVGTRNQSQIKELINGVKTGTTEKAMRRVSTKGVAIIESYADSKVTSKSFPKLNPKPVTGDQLKAQLLEAISKYGTDYNSLQTALPDWTHQQIQYCMASLKADTKNKPWKLDEVKRLKDAITIHGRNMIMLEKAVGTRTQTQIYAFLNNHSGQTKHLISDKPKTSIQYRAAAIAQPRTIPAQFSTSNSQSRKRKGIMSIDVDSSDDEAACEIQNQRIKRQDSSAKPKITAKERTSLPSSTQNGKCIRKTSGCWVNGEEKKCPEREDLNSSDDEDAILYETMLMNFRKRSQPASGKKCLVQSRFRDTTFVETNHNNLKKARDAAVASKINKQERNFSPLKLSISGTPKSFTPGNYTPGRGNVSDYIRNWQQVNAQSLVELQEKSPKQKVWFDGDHHSDKGDSEAMDVQRKVSNQQKGSRTLQYLSPSSPARKLFSEDEDDFPASLTSIEHLSKLTYTEGNLPVWHFTVYGNGGQDDTLYYFKAFVKKSSIPDAGLGAFLTFLGAKKLKKEKKDLNDQLMMNTIYVDPEFEEPLQAVIEEGQSGVTVYLKGENLEVYENRHVSMTNLIAEIPEQNLKESKIFAKSEEKIRIDGAGLPSDIERKMYYVSDPNRRIGFLGIHVETDYRWKQHAVFSSHNSIDLGRYGPFKAKDRITEELYALKTFILCHEPSEWDYEVHERLYGKPQIIGITDNATGRPNEEAQRNLPMYVNEVGHSKEYKQNVYIRQVDDRVVKYFLHLNEPLKQNQTIELLTNYNAAYEEVRERKGYGWRNLHKGLKSDSCFATRLERNFTDRSDAQNVISLEESIPMISYFVNFIREEIWNPIHDKLMQFLRTKEVQYSLTTTQWIATLRVQWIVAFLQQKIVEEEKKCRASEEKEGKQHILDLHYIHNIKRSLNLIQAEKRDVNFLLKSIIPDDNGNPIQNVILDEKGNPIHEAVKEEIIEEVGFSIRDQMPMFLNNSVYCPIARRLIEKLCVAVLALNDLRNTDDGLLAMETVRKDFFEIAWNAVKEVKESLQNFSTAPEGNDLVFSSGISIQTKLSISFQKAFEVSNRLSRSAHENTTLPKGFQAALLEQISYFDALSLSGEAPQGSHRFSNIKIPNQVVMVKYRRSVGREELQHLSSVPRSLWWTQKTSAPINDVWYIVWQVLWPVHVFSRYFLNESVYSLGSLCSHLGIAPTLANFAADQGIRHENYDHLYKYCKSAEGKRLFKPSKRKPSSASKTSMSSKTELCANGRAPPALMIYEGPVTKFPPEYLACSDGWVQRTFQRQSGGSKGGTDDYWYSPLKAHKLRSFPEIRRFFTALKEYGDEDTAFRARKG